MVAVVGLPGGVGASIVALVLSTASGAPARVVECCPPLLAIRYSRTPAAVPTSALVAAVIRCQAGVMASEDGVYARMFQRPAHPFSAWSRLLSTPLLLVPLWTRRWWLCGPIGAWFAVNPVITPPIRDTSSFATRAILGEESWSRNPTSEPVVLALSGVASASLVGAMVAAYQRRKAGAVIGTGVFMALTLWEWELWADRFARDSSRTGA